MRGAEVNLSKKLLLFDFVLISSYRDFLPTVLEQQDPMCSQRFGAPGVEKAT